MTDQETKYPPMSVDALCEELGLFQTQRNQPDFSSKVPTRFVSLEEAKARGLSSFYDGRACRYSHQASRRTSNPRRCSDCERVRANLPAVYPTSRAQQFYEQPRRPSKDATVVTVAPVAAAPLEMPKKDSDFLAALADTGSFEAACEKMKVSRGQIDARAVANEKFATALSSLCEQNMILRTVKAQSTFAWTPEIKRNLVRNFIDGGLMHLARESVGLPASEYFERLNADPELAAAVEAARPLALETLRERSLHAASTGNEKLLQFLTKNAEGDTPISGMTVDQLHSELEKLAERFRARGCLPNEMRHKVTGELINFDDLEYAQRDGSNADLVS